jgi:hypothetical protein
MTTSNNQFVTIFNVLTRELDREVLKGTPEDLFKGDGE